MGSTEHQLRDRSRQGLLCVPSLPQCLLLRYALICEPSHHLLPPPLPQSLTPPGTAAAWPWPSSPGAACSCRSACPR